MDTLYWTKLNSRISVHPTKKQYFGRYIWRLVYRIKKVSIASDKSIVDIIDFIKDRKEWEQNRLNGTIPDDYYSRNYKSRIRMPEWTDGVDEQLIDHVRTMMNKYKHLVKFRTESSTLQIYAETQDDLKIVSAEINADEHLVDINIPISGTEDALRNGHVFMNKIGYKYKVVLRDGNYDTHIKQSVLNQLSHRDDIKIPPNFKRELGKKYPALWGAYFYTNDDSIVTILSLISPGIVGKIHPIDHLQ